MIILITAASIVVSFGLFNNVEARDGFFSWTMEKFITEGKEVSIIINKGIEEINFSTQKEPVKISVSGREEIILDEKKEYTVKKGKDHNYEIQVFASNDYDITYDLYLELKENYDVVKLVEDEGWYKVRLGSFELRREALPLSIELSNTGLENWIVEIEDKSPESVGVYDDRDNLLLAAKELSVKGQVEISENIYSGEIRFLSSANGIDILNKTDFAQVVQGITAVELNNNRIEVLKRTSNLEQKEIEELIKVHLVTTRSNIFNNLLNSNGLLELPGYQGMENISSQIRKLYNETQEIVLNEEGIPAQLEFNTEYIFPLLVSNYSYREVISFLNPGSYFLDLTGEIKRRVRIDAEVRWGLDYKEIEQLTWWGPRLISVLELDLSHDDFIIESVLAENRVLGTKDLSEIVRANGALAGINGGYFSYTGEPLGLIIKDGQLLSEPIKNRTVFAFNRDLDFYIGNLEWSGSLYNEKKQKQIVISGINRKPGTDEIVLINSYYDEKAPALKEGIKQVIIKEGKIHDTKEGRGDLQPSIIPNDGFVIQAHGNARGFLADFEIGDIVYYKDEFQPDISSLGVISALGGGPRLIANGQIHITSEKEEFQSDITSGRAPRSAVGITADSRLIMVTIDGRQPELSIGMTLEELSSFMIDYGVVDAVNLDGGSSARMSVRGYTMSSPDRPREIGSAIIIRQDR